MASSASVTVSSTVLRLDTLISQDAQRIRVRNGHASEPLLLGGANLGTSNSFSLPAGQTIEIGREPPYGIRPSSTDVTPVQVIGFSS